MTGETGTGKELVARSLHARSARAGGPFVPINCAAIPPDLLESELFGHVKGAFTGAFRTKSGWLERANGGTLFLDEIGELPSFHQPKLLRVLENGKIVPVGAEKRVPVDFRLVSATSRGLFAAVTAGEFRADLWYRIAGDEIPLPPLRERIGDHEVLARHFAAAQTEGKIELSPAFLDAICAYPWPGNVRELENAVRRAVELSKDSVLTADLLPDRVLAGRQSISWRASPLSADFPTLETVERTHIRRALDRANGNQSRAARILGIHRSTLRRRLKKYGLTG